MFDIKEWSREYNQRPEVKERNREAKRRYKRNHPETEKRYAQGLSGRLSSRERKHLIRVNVLSHYSNPQGVIICNGCGEQDIEVLCLDHIEGGGNKHRKQAGIGSYLDEWLVKNNFPDGFQVLCHNCNFKKRRLDISRNKELEYCENGN